VSYETWRATFQSSEQAARAAYQLMQTAVAQDGTDISDGTMQITRARDGSPQVMGRISHLDDGSVIFHLNSLGRALPDHTPLYARAQEGK